MLKINDNFLPFSGGSARLFSGGNPLTLSGDERRFGPKNKQQRKHSFRNPYTIGYILGNTQCDKMRE